MAQLTFVAVPSHDPPYPHGYWYATTEDGGFDGAGEEPESALLELAGKLEDAVVVVP